MYCMFRWLFTIDLLKRSTSFTFYTVLHGYIIKKKSKELTKQQYKSSKKHFRDCGRTVHCKRNKNNKQKTNKKVLDTVILWCKYIYYSLKGGVKGKKEIKLETNRKTDDQWVRWKSMQLQVVSASHQNYQNSAVCDQLTDVGRGRGSGINLYHPLKWEEQIRHNKYFSLIPYAEDH